MADLSLDSIVPLEGQQREPLFYVKAEEGSLFVPITPPSREMSGTTIPSSSVDC